MVSSVYNLRNVQFLFAKVVNCFARLLFFYWIVQEEFTFVMLVPSLFISVVAMNFILMLTSTGWNWNVVKQWTTCWGNIPSVFLIWTFAALPLLWSLVDTERLTFTANHNLLAQWKVFTVVYSLKWVFFVKIRSSWISEDWKRLEY